MSEGKGQGGLQASLKCEHRTPHGTGHRAREAQGPRDWESWMTSHVQSTDSTRTVLSFLYMSSGSVELVEANSTTINAII